MFLSLKDVFGKALYVIKLEQLIALLYSTYLLREANICFKKGERAKLSHLKCCQKNLLMENEKRKLNFGPFLTTPELILSLHRHLHNETH